MSSAKVIGQRLRQLRATRTMDEVARACGISVSALGMYETGQRIPRDEIKVKLARFFNVSIELLFFADEVHES